MSEPRVTELRYVGLAVPDFETERRFIKGTWGLTEVASDGDVAYFAAEGSPEQFIIRLRKGEARSNDLIAFAADDRDAVDGLANKVAAAGWKMISQPGPLTSPGGGYGFRFFDPDGRALEISSDVAQRPYRELAKGESIPTTLSHVVLHSPQHKASVQAYADVLGFKLSDWLGELMAFMRCNKAHHRLAFLPGPAGLNHVAFDMLGMDEMMRGIGRVMKTKEAPLVWGPGRHTAGNNTFSYFTTPAGNSFEYTAELEDVGEDWEHHVYAMSPEITDQWGTGRMLGDHGFPKMNPDPGLWQAPPV